MVSISSATPADRAELPLIAFACVWPVIFTYVVFISLVNATEATQQWADAIGKSVQFGLPLVWIGLLKRQPLRWPKPNVRGLAIGAAFGLVVAIGMLALYFGYFKPAHIFDEAAVQMSHRLAKIGVTTTGVYAAIAIFYSLAHSLLEEYYWRWFVFGRLKNRLALRPAIVVSALAFMAHHVVVLSSYFGFLNPWTWFFSLATALGGSVWAWLYHRSGSIYGPWLSHLLIDAAVFGIGYDLMRTAAGL
jgi:membrane protease YdiL (CAAX protease family)